MMGHRGYSWVLLGCGRWSGKVFQAPAYGAEPALVASDRQVYGPRGRAAAPRRGLAPRELKLSRTGRLPASTVARGHDRQGTKCRPHAPVGRSQRCFAKRGETYRPDERTLSGGVDRPRIPTITPPQYPAITTD